VHRGLAATVEAEIRLPFIAVYLLSFATIPSGVICFSLEVALSEAILTNHEETRPVAIDVVPSVSSK
jgi:hypothetical protein